MNTADKYLVDHIEDPRTGDPVEFPVGYHAEGARLIYDLDRVLIADDMGVGKTASLVVGHYYMQEKMGEDFQTAIIYPGHLGDHWTSAIQEYSSVDPGIEVLESTDPDEFEPGEDFTLVNYGKLSQEVNGPLIKELRNSEFDLLGIDEAHRLRNPGTNRAKNVVGDPEEDFPGLVESIDNLCMLTGTPIYNSFDDAFQMIYMLEPDNYDSWKDVRDRHKNQPRRVASIMDTKWRRIESEEVIEDLPDLEDITQGMSTVDFTGTRHEEVYKAVLENDMLTGKDKLRQLRKAIQDPSLVDEYTEVDGEEVPVVFDDNLRDSLDDIPSQKYQKLEEVRQWAEGNDEKVVVYSLFREGVIEDLADRFNGLYIHGDVDMSDRGDVVENFENGDHNFLFATTKTAGEGFSITEAENVAFLEDPWTPAERQQAIKRVYRRGQEAEKVNVVNLRADGDVETIDQGKDELLEQKRDLIDFFIDGKDMSEKMGRLISHHDDPAMWEVMYTPQQKAYLYSKALVGNKTEDIYSELFRDDGKVAKSFAENFSKGWKDSYSANAARAYSKIVGKLARNRGEDDINVADLGSAFGPLHQPEISDLEPVNLDINRHNFFQERSAENGNVVGRIDQLPLKSGSFDVAVSSLSVFYNSPEGDYSEREQAIDEANEILRPGGHYIMTFPSTIMSKENRENLQEGLKEKGLRPLPQLTGFVRSEDPGVDFHTYLATAEKNGEPSDSTGDWFNFEEGKDDPSPTSRNDGIATHFTIKNLNGEEKRLIDVVEEHL